jgi:hypothetical protein
MIKNAKFAVIGALALGLTSECFAGKAMKWTQVPEAVRATVLANGGKAGTVDKESEKIDGKAVYEAVGKDKVGRQVDLVITEDGKLVTMKDDDTADKAEEQTARTVLAALKFNHSRDINNPWLPLGSLKQDLLEGKEGGDAVRIERTAKPGLHKSFTISGKKVQALAVEDREFLNGELEEVAMDFFVQADDGTVLYLGETVDEYKKGKIVGHSGSWMFGKDTKVPGVLMPGNPKVGDKFKSEDVSNSIREEDEVLSLSESVKTPAGAYENCLKLKEKLADGKTEYKYFAKGVGVVREVPEGGDVLLKSHAAK